MTGAEGVSPSPTTTCRTMTWAEPEAEPLRAVISTLPSPWEMTRPPATLATDGSEDDQVTPGRLVSLP